MKDPVTWLYPPIGSYNTGRLQVSPVHESGNPSGKPVIFLHGGPASGSEPKQHASFTPEKYRIRTGLHFNAGRKLVLTQRRWRWQADDAESLSRRR